MWYQEGSRAWGGFIKWLSSGRYSYIGVYAYIQYGCLSVCCRDRRACNMTMGPILLKGRERAIHCVGLCVCCFTP